MDADVIGLTTATASPDDWREVFLLLDTALDLEPAALDGWIESLPADRSRLAPMLRRLLADRADAQRDALLPSLSLVGFAVDKAPLAVSAAVPQGLVGPYRLLHEIGRGGMATVWLAERADGLLTRRIALKLPHMSWDSAGFEERMARERNILASLTHPNIARLYDAGIDDRGRPFLALEYVDGRPIDAYAAAHALGVRSRVELVVQVARAVADAHAQLVVHRDLKPSNILVDAQGRTHLLDFGIAKLIDAPRSDEGASAPPTLAQVRALTPDYASPEQIRGDLIGTASDIYSLGIVLFELLVGQRPYRLPSGAGPVALADALSRIELPRLSSATADASLRRQLAGDLDAIVGRALRQASAERYPTIAAFADDLERSLRGEPVSARPDSLWYRSERWVRRHKLETAVAAAVVVAVPAGAAAQAAVLVAIGIGAGVALWQMRVAREQAQVANREAARAARVKDFALSILEGANTDSGAGATTTAADVLKSAQVRIQRELGDNPETSVELMTSIGDGLHGLGELDAANEILSHATALARRELGPRHALTVNAMVINASVLVNLDRAKEAIALLLPAIDAARHLPVKHVLVDGLRWLSSAQTLEGQMQNAVATAEAAVSALPPPRDDRTKLAAVNAWASLASARSVAQREGQADAARQALAFAKDLYGERLTESVLSVRLMLGQGLATENRDAEALAELTSVRDDTVRFLGPDSPRLEFVGNVLGHVRVDGGDAVGGIEAFTMALEVAERRAGKESGAMRGLGYSALAKGYAAARRPEEALQHYDTATTMLQASTGPSNPYAQRARSARARVLTWAGRLDEADAAFAELDASPWTAGDAERAMHLGRLCTLRTAQGRHDEAIGLARQSVDGLTAHPSKVVRALASSVLGQALLAAGRVAEAIAPLEQAARLYGEKQLMPSADGDEARAALASARAALARGSGKGATV